jgi:hypothetical protein
MRKAAYTSTFVPAGDNLSSAFLGSKKLVVLLSNLSWLPAGVNVRNVSGKLNRQKLNDKLAKNTLERYE